MKNPMTHQSGRLIRWSVGPWLMAVGAAAGLMTAVPCSAERGEGVSGIAPGHSHAYGKTLTEWLETYWRWSYTGADPAQSTVGHVQLMPLPAGAYISGSGTPADPALYRGQLEITLIAGTPFVLPEFAWVWERYNNGTPDDVLMPDSVALANAHPRLTFDGRTVLSDANKAAYYVPHTAFDPIVVYPAPTSYDSIAALSFQSVGVVGEPMSVGRHVIHLYETLIAPDGAAPAVPPGGIGVIYDNTWIVTVLPEDLGNHDIAPPNSEPYGKSYGEWSARWWQWVYSLPAAENPVSDTTGEFADEGQDGPVWFLAGNFGGTTVRDVFVPEGKSLFFPILNQNWVTFPTDPILTIPELRAIIRPFMDNASLACSIDGKAVKHLSLYREDSAVFTTTVPDGNLLGLPAGDYAPCVDNGYYLMLDPLKPGQHTIHFTGINADASFALDVTYHLTVGKPAQIVPPDRRYRGKTYGEWSAAWWTWAMELPVTGPIPHPFVDDPAFDITEGQQGNVWFLASPVDTVKRTRTIPAGKALFFALLNVESSDLEGLGATEAEQRANAKWQADHIHNVACSVDGDPVEHIGHYRVESPQFSFTAPTPWLFGTTGGPGTSVSDGYFVMLKPLSKGSHTLRYTGNFHFAVAEGDPFDYDAALDMTYHLNVAPDHGEHGNH